MPNSECRTTRPGINYTRIVTNTEFAVLNPKLRACYMPCHLSAQAHLYQPKPLAVIAGSVCICMYVCTGKGPQGNLTDTHG